MIDDIKAAKIAIRNSYLRLLYGDSQLAYMFFEGMKYAKTGELPKNLLEDSKFINKQ